MVEMSYSYPHTSKNRHREFVSKLIGTEGVIRYDAVEKIFRMEVVMISRRSFRFKNFEITD